MCLGNRAENSAHFINAQLSAHYENARRCVEKHFRPGRKPDSVIVEQSTCLFEWYGGAGKNGRIQASAEDLGFHACFGPPRVEFVCNHELILYLDIHSGHYNLDYQNTKAQPKHDKHERINNYTIAFRVEFSTHSVNGFQCKVIGNSDSYTMKLHILDVERAVYVAELSSIAGITTAVDEKAFVNRERKLNALLHYITKQYLVVFKRAGLHVLHSLPDFDNQINTTAHIDYSVIAKRRLSTYKIYGCTVDEINSYLRSLWLQAVSYHDHCGKEENLSVSKFFLAEHTTQWEDSVEDLLMHMCFGPLQIQALCQREVILYIDLLDVDVFFGEGSANKSRYRFKNWKLAIIVDICYEVTDGGCIKRIKFDMRTARFCEHLSVIKCSDTCKDEEFFTRIRHTLVRYITHYYLSILETFGCGYAYHWDGRLQIEDDCSDSDSDDKCDCFDDESCTCGYTGVRFRTLHGKRITHTDMHGFDIITGVTQASINAHLRTLWESAHRHYECLGEKTKTWSTTQIEYDTCQADWSYVHKNHGEEIFFCSSFDAPKIQLLCAEGSQKVRFFVSLKEGYMRLLGEKKSLLPGSHPHQFSNWRVAFDVDLKVIDSTKETVTDVITKRIGNVCHSFKHLVLDLSSARLNLCLSSLPGLVDCQDARLVRTKYEALVFYITHHYFPTLMHARHHILYTIPIDANPHDKYHKHMLTSVKFQILPFAHTHGHTGFIEGLFGKQRSIFDRNMVVFLGMFEGRQMPCGFLPRGVNWVCGTTKDAPQGVVCVSRRAFLQARILSILEEVNCDTTIVPNFSGIRGGKWVLKLTSWKNHEDKENDACKWTEVSGCSDSLVFQWKNIDHWCYKHEGDFRDVGHYVVKCETVNKVTVPTSLKRTATCIEVEGTVKLFLEYKGALKDWSASITAKWSATIKFLSDPCAGLKVIVQPASIVPKLEVTETKGELGHGFHLEMFKHLQSQLPSAVEFSKVVHGLKHAFEGCWSGLHAYSRELHVVNPVFNKHGDFLLDLGIHSPNAAQVPSQASSGMKSGFRGGVGTGIISYISNAATASLKSLNGSSVSTQQLPGATKITKVSSESSTTSTSTSSSGYTQMARSISTSSVTSTSSVSAVNVAATATNGNGVTKNVRNGTVHAKEAGVESGVH